MTLFKNKYRIESSRLKGWDYRRTGAYFITICTKNREKIFGNVVMDKVVLNDIGKIVEEEWLKTPKIRNYVELDVFIIMPNHLHGIIFIYNDDLEKKIFEQEIKHLSFQNEYNKNHYLKSKSISSFINQFKSVTTKRIKRLYINDFSWQSRFYDHIIRNENSLSKIRDYILHNPIKWTLDEYY